MRQRRKYHAFGIKLHSDEFEAIQQARDGLSDSEILREALTLWCAKQGIEFPAHETMPYGGQRDGAGRKAQKLPRN